jgi:hypothetical protein
MKHILIILILLLAGCSSTREIIEMEPYLSEAELENPNHQTVDKIRKFYFTNTGYEAIKSIPVIDGPALSSYSAGVNFWSNVASFLTCNGTGRKVITTESSLGQWGVAALVHEYIHHLDDIDRDGDAEFIDHEEFKRMYGLMANDRHWRGLFLWAEKQNDMQTSKVFGIGDMSEQIAYVGQHLMIKGTGPEYMKYVFRRMLRLKYTSSTTYTTTDGRKILLKFGE